MTTFFMNGEAWKVDDWNVSRGRNVEKDGYGKSVKKWRIGWFTVTLFIIVYAWGLHRELREARGSYSVPPSLRTLLGNCLYLLCLALFSVSFS